MTNKTYSRQQLVAILMLIGAAGIISPISSAIYFPALIDIRNNLNTTDALMDVTVAGFLVTMGIFPLLWGTLADAYGRRGVFLVSMFLYSVSSAACGLAQSIAVLIAMRIVQGATSSAAMVTGAGVITDIFPPEKRGTALGTFLIGPLIGPVIGPIIGGYFNEYLGWRCIFWFLATLGVLILVCLVFFLPETLSQQQAYPFTFTLCPPSVQRTGSPINPFHPLTYLKYSKVTLVIAYVCIIYSSYYFITSLQTRVLSKVYSLTSSQVGLCYIPLGLGNLVGSITGGRISDAILHQYRQKSSVPRPEVRLYGVAWGAISIVVGLAALGFCLELRWPLAATLGSEFLVGFGMTSVFSGTSTYLIDLFSHHASSIMACNTCLRTLAAAIVTSLNTHILNNLSYTWAFSTFTLLQLPGILALIFLIFFANNLYPLPSKKSDVQN
ncbi:hypothetical protein DSO57_1015264 [Entomophthora muscae]|uniref:Uncharacterized protein n=1 Tax=Entomophthora muscae TaxID=34485 RepID=A0ACC2T5A5_9FUNG|nr:hypothetical protein DSO57_1015264 [Entomophthora muscae]